MVNNANNAPQAAPASDTSTAASTQVSQLTAASLNNYIQQGIAAALENLDISNNGNNANKGNQNGNRGGRGGRGGRGRGGRCLTWRQYTKYCFSRDVNLRCKGLDCDQQGCDKKPNHDATCTFDQRLTKGGLRHLEGRWMK